MKDAPELVGHVGVLTIAAWLAFLVIAPVGAGAQPLNTAAAESGPPQASGSAQAALTAGKPGPAGWSLTGDVSFAGMTGNTDTATIVFGGTYLRSWPSWGLVAKASGTRVSAGSAPVAEAYFIAFETSRKLTERLSMVIGESIYRNPFSGLAHRNRLGAGIRWVTARTTQWDLTVLTAAGWEHDNYINAFSADIPTTLVLVENHVQISATTSTKQSVAWFQDLQDSGNYRVHADASIQSAVTHWLGLQLAWAMRFDNEPVDAPEKTDMSFTAGFQFNLHSGQ